MRRSWLPVICAACLFQGHQGAAAAEWYLEGSASERLAYDDNVGFNRRNAVSDFSSKTSLDADLGARSESLELELDARFDYTAFFDETDLNSDDERVIGRGSYKTPQTNWELGAAYDRDTTRTSEVDDTGLFILENERRQATEVWGASSYQATREDRLFLGGEYNHVVYDGDLIDYDRYGGRLGWARQLTRVDELEVAGFATRVEADTRSNKDTNIFGLRAAWTTMPINGLTVGLGIGGYHAKTKFDPPSSLSGDFDNEKAWGFLPSASIDFMIDPRTSFTAEYARLVVPSASGDVLERDRLDVGAEFRWSPRAAVALDLRYQAQRGIEDDDNDGRDFIRVVPSVVWNMTENWALRAAYRFRWQDFEGDSNQAVSNAVLVTLSFSPERWWLSR